MRPIITTCVAATLGAASAFPAVAADRADAFTRTAEDRTLDWAPCPDFMPQGCEIAVLHADQDGSNADIFFRVPGGSHIARHWHTSPERIVVVSGEMEVTYDGQEPVVLTPRTYAHGPARKPHHATCLSTRPCTLFIAFVDPIDAVKGAPEN